MSETAIKGLAELQRALDALPAKIEANIMRGAIRAGCKVLQKLAQANAPTAPPNPKNAARYGGREGLLRDSIRVSLRLKRGTVTGRVVAGGKGKGGGDAYYARWVEYGTKPHVIKAKPGKLLAVGVPVVHHPGAAPRPYLRPALDMGTPAAVQAVREYIRQRLATKHGVDVPAPPEGDAA